jgi:hypothetical protein
MAEGKRQSPMAFSMPFAPSSGGSGPARKGKPFAAWFQ